LEAEVSAANEQRLLLGRLVRCADLIAPERSVVLSREVISELRREVSEWRDRLLDPDEPRLIDYEATCLVEIMAELTYARADQDRARESRAEMYLDKFRVMLRGDYDIAEREAALRGDA
jgi:hypothetical protein